MLATALLRQAQPFPRTPWRRGAGNPILSAAGGWEANNSVQEPTLIYESGTWKMWYTGGFSTTAMGYATCTGDPTVAGNWTKYALNPVLGQGGSGVAGNVAAPNVVKVGSTYYAYYYTLGRSSDLKVSTSSDGIAWGAPTTAIVHNQVAWMTGWANTFVWNEGGTTWKMLVEGSATLTGPWNIAYATSTDGLSWAVQGAGPLTSLKVSGLDNYGAPWLAAGGVKTNGLYQLWFHAGSGDYSAIYHAYSTDAQTWTITSGQELAANGSTYEKQQVADPSVLEVSGVGYLFYDGVDNIAPAGYINVATYPGDLSSLVRWEP